MFCFTKYLTFGSWTIYGPKVIRLLFANFQLVKCCLLYYRQVNKYNQVKAGSLFYSPGKNCRWPVKTVPLWEFSVRSLWRISRLIIQLLIIAQLLLFPTILFHFIFYILTKSFRVKNWNKCKIRSPNNFLQPAYQQTNLFAFSVALVLYHESRKPAISHGERTWLWLRCPFWHGSYAF